MPIQYSPFPEFQVPNVNILGALAQGQASAAQELQAQKLAQSTDLAAKKALQDTEAFELKKKADELDFAVKNAGIFKDRVLQIDPNKPDAQMQYNKLLQEFQPKAPSILGGLPTEFNADTQRSIITSHDDFIKLTTPQERDTVIDGRSGKGLFIFDPYSQTQRMVGGSFQGAPEKWSPVRGEKQEIIYYTNPSGTQMLSPEEYKTRMTQKEQPVEAPAARGQAGNFAAPTDVYNNVPMAQVKQGFAKTESGSPQGNYAALGPVLKSGDRAYGKYQVMGANIPSWTKQALGRSMTPEEFLADSDAQEKVFENQFERNFKKYGTLEDAASVWFSGRPLAQATKAGARDVNMGVPEYVQRVVGGMGPVRNVPTAPLTGVSPSLRALTEQPVNAMAPPLPPMNAMAAPVQMPQLNAAPAPTPMAQAAPVAAAPPKIEPLTTNYPGIKKFSVGTEKQAAQDVAINMLNRVGFDVKSGSDEIEKNLAKASKSGPDYLKATWNDFNGRPSEEAQANSTLDALAQQVSIGLAGGSLGAGISGPDKAAFDKAAGDLGAWYKSPETRLAAWRTIKEILSRTNGIPYDRPAGSKIERAAPAPAAPAAPAPAPQEAQKELHWGDLR
jgi:hypothetical protein